MIAMPEKKSVPDIRFHCPHCRGRLVVDLAAAGHHANCPHCSRRILIPPPGEAGKPAAPTSSGIIPATVSGILTTTQKIDEQKKTAAPVAPPPARKSEPLVTQKISDAGAAAAPRAFPQAAVSLPAASRGAYPPSRLDQTPASQTQAGDATNNQARQLLTGLIDGLKRENAELKKKLAAMPLAPATPPTAVSAPDHAAMAGELERLQKSAAESVANVAMRDATIRELDAASAKFRGEWEASVRALGEAERAEKQLREEIATAHAAVVEQQKQADASAKREEEITAQTAELKNKAEQSAARAAELEKIADDLRRSLAIEAGRDQRVADELALLKRQFAAQHAEAVSTRLDLGAARLEIVRLKKEAGIAAQNRDMASSEAAHARQLLKDCGAKEAQLLSNLDEARSLVTALVEREKETAQKNLLAERGRDALAVRLRDAESLSARLELQVSAPREPEMSGPETDRLRAELATVSAQLSAACEESAHSAAERLEAETEIERLRTDWNRLVSERKALESRLARSLDEAEQLTSEKSALVIAFAEMEDRARDIENERARYQETRARLAGVQEENAFLREQLEAAAKVSADVEHSKKRSEDAEAVNLLLRDQLRRLEHETVSKETAAGPSFVETKLKRRIDELEGTLRTAETVTRQMKSRLSAFETGQQQRQTSDTLPGAAPEQESVRDLERRTGDLATQVQVAEARARESDNARDAAIRAKNELEHTLHQLNEQAGDLQREIDSRNLDSGATPGQRATLNRGGKDSPRKVHPAFAAIAIAAVFLAFILWYFGR